jgi:hypothetical protein
LLPQTDPSVKKTSLSGATKSHILSTNPLL